MKDKDIEKEMRKVAEETEGITFEEMEREVLGLMESKAGMDEEGAWGIYVCTTLERLKNAWEGVTSGVPIRIAETRETGSGKLVRDTMWFFLINGEPTLCEMTLWEDDTAKADDLEPYVTYKVSINAYLDSSKAYLTEGSTIMESIIDDEMNVPEIVWSAPESFCLSPKGLQGAVGNVRWFRGRVGRVAMRKGSDTPIGFDLWVRGEPKVFVHTEYSHSNITDEDEGRTVRGFGWVKKKSDEDPVSVSGWGVWVKG